MVSSHSCPYQQKKKKKEKQYKLWMKITVIYLCKHCSVVNGYILLFFLSIFLFWENNIWNLDTITYQWFLCCQATGLGISVQVVKNKLAPSMAKAELSIRFGKGICCESEALDLACEHGVIVKDGSCYFLRGKILHSREEVLRYLASNDGALDDIIRTLRCHLFERQMAWGYHWLHKSLLKNKYFIAASCWKVSVNILWTHLQTMDEIVLLHWATVGTSSLSGHLVNMRLQ